MFSLSQFVGFWVLKEGGGEFVGRKENKSYNKVAPVCRNLLVMWRNEDSSIIQILALTRTFCVVRGRV